MHWDKESKKQAKKKNNTHLLSERFYFWPNRSATKCTLAPMQCCDHAKLCACSKLVRESETKSTWRDDYNPYCYTLSPSLCFLSPAFIPFSCLHSTSSVYFVLSHQCPSQQSLSSHSHFQSISLFSLFDYLYNNPLTAFSLFQIISLLNVFTPQKSLEEFQDV